MKPPVEIRLWPAAPPDGLLQHGEAEVFSDHTAPDQRLDRRYASVTRPTITVHRPVGPRISRAGVVIFPGGGYQDIWIDKEGYDIARWLNTLGLTAFVVKYRVGPQSARDLPFDQVPETLMKEVLAASLADSQRALRLVRQRSAEWGIDPDAIGVIGFSAGGHLILNLLLHAGAGDLASPDPIDQMNSKPNFSILVYPDTDLDLASLPADTGPVFIAQAGDDHVTPAAGVVSLMQVLLEKNVPIEAHIFQRGGHGFGLGIEGGPVRSWMSLCESWLRDMGYLAC